MARGFSPAVSGRLVRRQSWPGSSAPGSARRTSQFALRADPVRACHSSAGYEPPEYVAKEEGVSHTVTRTTSNPASLVRE